MQNGNGGQSLNKQLTLYLITFKHNHPEFKFLKYISPITKHTKPVTKKISIKTPDN